MRTPTTLFMSIFLPLLIKYLNEILRGVKVNPIEAVIRKLGELPYDPFLLINTFLLGDVMPYLYALVILLAYAKRKGLIASVRDELGLNIPKRPVGPKAFMAIGVLSLWLAYYVAPLMPHVRPDKAIFAILAYTLMPISISEELLFRGFMLSRLMPISLSQASIADIRPLLPSVLLDAAYFSIVHMPIYALTQGLSVGMALSLFDAFLFGLIACITAISFGSCIPCVFLHWITDFLIFLSN